MYFIKKKQFTLETERNSRKKNLVNLSHEKQNDLHLWGQHILKKDYSNVWETFSDDQLLLMDFHSTICIQSYFLNIFLETFVIRLSLLKKLLTWISNGNCNWLMEFPAPYQKDPVNFNFPVNRILFFSFV